MPGDDAEPLVLAPSFHVQQTGRLSMFHTKSMSPKLANKLSTSIKQSKALTITVAHTPRNQAFFFCWFGGVLGSWSGRIESGEQQTKKHAPARRQWQWVAGRWVVHRPDRPPPMKLLMSCHGRRSVGIKGVLVSVEYARQRGVRRRARARIHVRFVGWKSAHFVSIGDYNRWVTLNRSGSAILCFVQLSQLPTRFCPLISRDSRSGLRLLKWSRKRWRQS
jgi:hypothetical protein